MAGFMGAGGTWGGNGENGCKAICRALMTLVVNGLKLIMITIMFYRDFRNINMYEVQRSGSAANLNLLIFNIVASRMDATTSHYVHKCPYMEDGARTASLHLLTFNMKWLSLREA